MIGASICVNFEKSVKLFWKSSIRKLCEFKQKQWYCNYEL